MAEYPKVKGDNRGTDITFRTLLLPQLPQNNLYKKERGNKTKLCRVHSSKLIFFFKVTVLLKGADKMQIFGKIKNIKINLFHP